MPAKNFVTNLKKDPRTPKTNHDNTNSSEEVPAEESKTKSKKKTGRPKTKEGEYKTINISVPIDILAQMEVAKLKYGNNLTAYVNAVIKADLDANYEKYLQLQELMNS